MNTRRNLLTLGSLAVMSGLYRRFQPESASTQISVWEQRLGELAEWVVFKNAEDGALEAHCGVADASLWAGRSRKIAGEAMKIKASGNVFSFQKDGRAVRVIMLPVDAVV